MTIGHERLENLESYSSGVFWVGVMPYGVYYIHETEAPTHADGKATGDYSGNIGKWFCLIVNETGAYMSEGFNDGGTDKDNKDKA